MVVDGATLISVFGAVVVVIVCFNMSDFSSVWSRTLPIENEEFVYILVKAQLANLSLFNEYITEVSNATFAKNRTAFLPLNNNFCLMFHKATFPLAHETRRMLISRNFQF